MVDAVTPSGQYQSDSTHMLLTFNYEKSESDPSILYQSLKMSSICLTMKPYNVTQKQKEITTSYSQQDDEIHHPSKV